MQQLTSRTRLTKCQQQQQQQQWMQSSPSTDRFQSVKKRFESAVTTSSTTTGRGSHRLLAYVLEQSGTTVYNEVVQPCLESTKRSASSWVKKLNEKIRIFEKTAKAAFALNGVQYLRVLSSNNV